MLERLWALPCSVKANLARGHFAWEFATLATDGLIVFRCGKWMVSQAGLAALEEALQHRATDLMWMPGVEQ